MPNRWPIASGNWSDSAIWSGSIIPTASDDVFTNNQRVNIDTNVTIRSIRNSATGSAVASSAQANCFYLNDGVTLTATTGGVIGAVNNASFFPTIIVSGSSSSTIIGNISTPALTYACAIIMQNGASLTISGSITPGNAGAAPSQRTIISSSTGSLRISGSVNLDGSTYFGSTIWLTGATRVDINGNLYGSPNASAFYAIENGGGATVTVTGSLIGSSTGTLILNSSAAGTVIISGSILCAGSTQGVSNTSTGTIIVTGSVISAGVAAISNTSTGTVSISGSVRASTAASGVTTSGAGILRIIGPISASTAFPGIQSTSTGQVFLTGPFYNTNNRNAVFAQNLQLISGSTPTWTFDTETAREQRTLYTQNYPGNFPATTNVRQGITFGDVGQFTGVVVIPSASNVLKGVPIDATTGSASFTTQNVWSVSTASLTATGSIGERLRNASTVATDANLITSKGTL